MPAFFSTIITGDKKVDFLLASMPHNLERKLIRSSMRKAAKPLRKQMKKNIPKDTTQAESTIVTRAMKRSRIRFNKLHGKIGIRVRTDPKLLAQIHQRIPTIFNPHWLEYGVPGHVSGPLPAQPWARPAAHSVRPIVVAIFVREVRDAVYQTIRSGIWVP